MPDAQPPHGPNPPPLTVRRQDAPGGVTLAVTGELDLTTYDQFCQILMDEADRPTRDALALDLMGALYTDARAWKLIAQAHRQMTAAGRPLVVRVAPGGQPERVCRLLKLGRLVTPPERFFNKGVAP